MLRVGVEGMGRGAVLGPGSARDVEGALHARGEFDPPP